MKFGYFIRERRECIGLKQRDMAIALSVDVPMYCRYELGKRQIPESMLPLLSQTLHLNPIMVRKLWISDKILSILIKENEPLDILKIVSLYLNKAR